MAIDCHTKYDRTCNPILISDMFVVVPIIVVQICNEHNGNISSLYAEIFNTLIFSILRGGKSKEWKRSVGLRRSKLRKLVVLNAIANAQNNRFGKFEYDRSNYSTECHLHGANYIDGTARNKDGGIL